MNYETQLILHTQRFFYHYETSFQVVHLFSVLVSNLAAAFWNLLYLLQLKHLNCLENLQDIITRYNLDADEKGG